MKNSEFYDNLAGIYDTMIDLEKSVKNKKKTLSRFDLNGGKAMDVGCGTGVDSIALSELGYEVEGFDPSEEMIRKAKENAEQAGAEVKFQVADISEIEDIPAEKFDCAVSLGNALANIDIRSIVKGLENINRSLKKGSRFLLQILNYDKILEEQERVVNIKNDGDSLIVRFYDFNDNGMKFNILKTDLSDTSRYNLITTDIFPHTRQEMEQFLTYAGFTVKEILGGLDRKEYSRKSKDLVILAEKKK